MGLIQTTQTMDNLSHKYQQKTDKQHILDNPDTYIGSIEEVDSQQWILNENGEKIYEKNISYVPALFKLFDEGIVNCRDHCIRMQQAIAKGTPDSLPVTYIDISVNQEDGTITMTNDGNGIDVAEHPEYKIWIPELIFGHLRTSTNYDKTEKKIVGGKNGFGFKLVLIWSTYGSIETVDHVRGLKYFQEFNSNLDVLGKPKITKASKTKPYTKITFRPDYARLGLTGLTDDMIALLKKRVYDVAAVTDKSLKVKYNSVPIPIKTFQHYLDMYIGSKEETKRAYEEGGDRWEFAVALSPNHEFMQVSFVNGIHCSKGGKHVEYILGQITRKLAAFIEKKKKITVNANSIKEQLILFLRCDVENPSFDSQTKDYMNTPSSKFGSTCTVSDKFIEKVAKMGVMDAACAITEVKENKAAKKTDGVKTKNIRGIPKLIDANWAGTERSAECSIIFCEGDSAKAGIVSGLSSEDRNIIGVYPMKGKILNVRGEQTKKIAENKEIADIKKILGLETGRSYSEEDVKKVLRYGKIVFMTDQDLDGSHIKGLGINLFQSEWASLSNIPNFIGFMNTPILKARKGNQELVFYNEGEYQTWKTEQLGLTSDVVDISEPVKGWKIKYYKGLGTSTGKEFREYFEKKKFVGFNHSGKSSDDAIDMVFNKKRADDRKIWLGGYNREDYLDTNKSDISYEEFINKELIHFSKYDCDRSIPNLMDGLKISLRKILYSAFKKGLTHEIKVAQFTGYVSEHSGYHHGEASLNAAIVGLAQNFVGSNNINLFAPNGQFGTRLKGGQDSASERYIFTHLNRITRHIFNEQDDKILKYLNDDGLLVEPLYYAPILPMILVNGTKGIGTGFSTDIMSYNPTTIIQYLKSKLMLEDTSSIHFIPYYEGFTGTITPVTQSNQDGKFLIRGKYEKVGPDKIRVTELPVGTWTDDFKEYLENFADASAVDKTGKKIPAIVKDYDDMSKDTTIDFTITLAKGKVAELEAVALENGCNGLEKQFKLFTTGSTSNMHLFDATDKLKKYGSVKEIIDDYFETRLHMYKVRKEYMIEALTKDLVLLTNKMRYIRENLDGTIDLRRKKKDEVVAMLKNKGFDVIGDDEDYKYLTKMAMDSVTEENVAKLEKEHGDKETELNRVKETTIQQMWFGELEKLEEEYVRFREERERSMSGDAKKKSGGGANIVKKKSAPKKQLTLVENNE
jgi:DNA topoisomerase-2